MSKIILYQEPVTGVTTNGEQYAFFISEDGLPTIKNGSQVLSFGTSGYALQGSSGSSGENGTNGLSGTSGQDGSDGSSGQDGEAGTSGSSGEDGSSGSSGADGLSGDNGSSGSSGQTYGTSGRSGSSGSSGTSLAPVTQDISFNAYGSDYVNFANNGAVRGYVDYVLVGAGYGQTNINTIQQYFNNSQINDYPNNSIAQGNIGLFSGKKITDVILVRRPNRDVSVPAGTEIEYASLELIIQKAAYDGTTDTFTYSILETIDISDYFDINYSGDGTQVSIPLTSYNIQAAYNEGITFYIKAVLTTALSSNKWANIAAFDMYFTTVASGILGTNGTAGSSGSSGFTGLNGSNGSSGSSGLSFGTSGISGTNGQSGSSGSSGGTGSSGSSGATGSSGSSGETGGTGSSGSSGASGSSGTSAGGGGGTIFLSDFGGALLDDTQTNQNGFKYLYGVYGNLNHWGYDDIRNYEYGQTIPAIVPVGKKIKTVYFPIQCEIAEEDIDFKFVVWSKKAGTFYPYYYLGHVDHTFNFETTGYKVIAFDLNFENDGTLTGVTDDTLFLSVVANDVNMAMKFRKSVIYYDDTLKGGIFNPTSGDFASNQLWGANRVFNSSWFGGNGIPGIYGPGPGNGYTQGETWIPMFYSIADI